MKPFFFIFLAVSATAAFSNEPPVAITQQSSAVPIQAKATPSPAPAALPTADPDKLIPPSQAAPAAKDPAEMYFDKRALPLTPEEQQALSIAKDWRDTSDGQATPIVGTVGQVRYVYGKSQPSILCEPLQVTDIALEPGEQVSSVNIGDNVRWTVDSASSGSDDGEVMHLIVKPLDVGLVTSLVITTDRRTYYVNLKSLADQYMQRVAFEYPDTAEARARLQQAQAAQEAELKRQQEMAIAKEARERKTEYERPKDYGYIIKGQAPWKPLKVWNDGVKTYIRMPSDIQEQPSLMLSRGKARLFKKAELVLVNYRVHGETYVVDSVISKGILQIGVGGDAQKITIIHITYARHIATTYQTAQTMDNTYGYRK